MNHTTRRFPRTTAEAFGLSPSEANPFQSFKPSRIKRFFYAICDWGWVAVPVLLAVAVLTGCGEVDTYRASQSDLSDAEQQRRRDTAAQYACGPQSAYEWVNESTIQCFTKRGRKAGEVEVAAK